VWVLLILWLSRWDAMISQLVRELDTRSAGRWGPEQISVVRQPAMERTLASWCKASSTSSSCVESETNPSRWLGHQVISVVHDRAEVRQAALQHFHRCKLKMTVTVATFKLEIQRSLTVLFKELAVVATSQAKTCCRLSEGSLHASTIVASAVILKRLRTGSR